MKISENHFKLNKIEFDFFFVELRNGVKPDWNRKPEIESKEEKEEEKENGADADECRPTKKVNRKG